MRYIQKNKTGVGYTKLLQIHKTKGCYADTKNDNSKTPKVTIRTDILKDLLHEQGNLCAYCMRRISSANSTIEHIIGQEYIDDNKKDIGKIEDTNYQNMLAVCLGRYCKKIIKAKEKLHCDKSRAKYQEKYKDKEAEEKYQVLPTYRPHLHISPLNRQQMNNIKFSQSGVIYYENIDDETEISFDLNKVLNLNCENIKEERKRISNIVKSLLIKHKFDKNFTNKQLECWESRNGSYKEYCQVAIYLLRKYV